MRVRDIGVIVDNVAWWWTVAFSLIGLIGTKVFLCLKQLHLLLKVEMYEIDLITIHYCSHSDKAHSH